MARKYINFFATLLPWVLAAQVNAQSTAAGGASQSGTDSSTARVFIYPKSGQSEAQQSQDRYECYTWANKQSGFDPSIPGGGVASGENASRRSNYQRAMSACLEARGYSVNFPPAPVAAPSAPPAPPRYVATPIVEHYSPPPPPELKYHPFEFQIDGGYDVTTSNTHQSLDDGANAGLGLTWFPTSVLPVGLRVDGSYNWFKARHEFNSTGTGFTSGNEDVYGGDADLQLDLAHRSSRNKLYVFGGAGRYRERTDFRQVSLVNGTICGYFGCGPGVYPAVTGVDRSTSEWHNAWNAGIGWEIALADRGSFFIEARFLRILPTSNKTDFVPIRLGFRF